MLKKSFSKTGQKCRVTFELSPEVKAKKVSLCGEFNEWSTDAHVMKRRKNGTFSTTISLQTGRPYRFKYLLDGKRWENDWAADAYVHNCFGAEDSVVKL